MSKTEAILTANKADGAGSLVGYFPIGYPTLEGSIEAAVAMCQNGVDVLELGVPYSDPVMDGPVIQAATLEALEGGFKLSQVFEAVREVVARTEAAVLVMTYWNPVLQYGVERFAKELAAAGGAGLITPDLIPDEAGEWLRVSDELGLDRVFLATPSSSQGRVANTCNLSRGFVYAVSTMGITGARAELDAKARSVVASVREASTTALTCVGIGVSTAEQVAEINEYADGAIVGSAFVRAYQTDGLPGLVAKVRELRARV
jgi:tryptophan synthase alpha chain